MSSANTLKHKITVSCSFYGALFVFSLYLALIVLALLLFGISWLTFPIIIALLSLAGYGGGKQYLQQCQLQLSDSGLIEVVEKSGETISAEVSERSFYNSLFIALRLQHKRDDLYLIVRKKLPHNYLMIYRDAVSEPEYRFLARLINSRRD